MTRITSRVLTVAIILSISGAVRACFSEEGPILMSSHLERTVSHVLVGTLKAFRAIEETPGRYIAEVVVAEAEKGKGVAAGDMVRVRFTSPLSLEQLQMVAPMTGHGGGQTTPVPSERLRLYTQLTESSEYVADYPNCFFALDPRANLDYGWNSADGTSMNREPIVVVMLAIAGFSLSLAFLASHRARAKARRAAQLPVFCHAQLLEGQIANRISEPVAVDGASPVGVVHGESLGLHGMGREITLSAIPGDVPAAFGGNACFDHATL